MAAACLTMRQTHLSGASTIFALIAFRFISLYFASRDGQKLQQGLLAFYRGYITSCRYSFNVHHTFSYMLNT